MTKVLLINPNRWGRGITAIWIASHSAILKDNGHDVKLFDATFFKDWSFNETKFNTDNKEFLPTDYENLITLNNGNIFKALQKTIDDYKPDLIFWSALSSHIHGEGEYVNIQNGHMLISNVKTDAIKIAAGLQPTAEPKMMFERFPQINYFIGGESEFVLANISNNISKKIDYSKTPGLVKKINNEIIINPPQQIISNLDTIPFYDYSLFEDQAFLRPYNGDVVRAVDYELSRGCVYVCSYCVETVIQSYYGFNDSTSNGVLKNSQSYLRTKSAERVFNEIKFLYEKYGITLIRCQDTNFLTIDSKVLYDLANLFDKNNLPISLFIETRSEGITPSSIQLLKRLHVDAIGTGVEVSSEEFRKTTLNRHPSQQKIINAFKLLREAGIKTTAYNIIGLPGETEEMIIDTIKFNQILEPNTVVVAFYSPYIGTKSQIKAKEMGDFSAYEENLDSKLRTVSKSSLVNKRLQEFYKKYFVKFVREGFSELDSLKIVENI